MRPFELRRICCRFPVGCVDLVKLRFYSSPDSDNPTAGPPNGLSMLADYGQVDYIIGDGDEKQMEHELEINHTSTYLKVYAQNDDYFAHLVDVQMYIEPKESE